MIMKVMNIERRSRFNGRIFYNMFFFLDLPYHDLSFWSISENILEWFKIDDHHKT